jgi:tRNA dimethylallyltransferase
MKSLSKPLLIVIAGPTASGKTALSIDIARHFDADIISCDARQFYREMSIGTAKPSAEELASAKHHFIDTHAVEENYSAGDYEKDVLAFLDNYFKERKIAVMVGGSGLFMRVVCEGVDSYPEVPENIRLELKAQFEKEGIEPLQKELLKSDPIYYTKVDLNNPHRIIRALEVCRTSNLPFSSFQGKEREKRPFQVLKFALDWNREILYDRINRRVDKMIAEGLESEALKLYPKKHLNALQTVGYQEFFDFFDGKMNRVEAVEKIKQHSRNYAKRQVTWLKKEKDIHWINMPTKTELILESIIHLLNKNETLP